MKEGQVVGHVPFNPLAPIISLFLRRDVNKAFARERVVRCEAPENLGEWLLSVRYLEVEMYVKARSGREKCPLFQV